MIFTSGRLSHGVWQQIVQVPLDSVLFPISTYLLNVLKKIKIDLSSGSWWFSLELRQLRLRNKIKALYLYDLHTEEHMILYRKGTVSIADQYCLTTTIDNRWEVGGCLSDSQCVPEFKFGFSSDHVHVFKFVAESPRCGPEVAMVSTFLKSYLTSLLFAGIWIQMTKLVTVFAL